MTKQNPMEHQEKFWMFLWQKNMDGEQKQL